MCLYFDSDFCTVTPFPAIIADDYNYFGFNGYNYGGENTFKIYFKKWPDELDLFCLNYVGVMLFYRYKLAIRFIQAYDGSIFEEGTQIISDYKETEEKENILYESKLKSDGKIDDMQSFIKPVVVPYSKDPGNPRYYKLHISLYGAEVANDGEITRTKIEWYYEKNNKQFIGPINGREFDIRIPAPDKPGTSLLTLTYTVERNYGDYPSENWKLLNEHTIKIPVYAIFDFSKPIASNPNKKYSLPSSDVISMALGYTRNAKTEELATAMLTQGIYDNRKHKYDSQRQHYTSGANTECNSNASFKFGSYLKNINYTRNDDVYLDCLDTSFLYYILARSVGLNVSLYGIGRNITTSEVKPMGDNKWMTYNWQFHQSNLRSENVYDSTVKYKKDQQDNKGSYVINMLKQDYSIKVLNNEGYLGYNCSDPALISIIY